MDDAGTSGRAAGAIADAAILVAVASLPLYFTLLSQNGYEAEKSILLRALAIIAAAGWAVSATSSTLRSRRFRLDPLMGLAVLVTAAYSIATVFSIDPRLSLWGSLQRQQGLVTHLCYFALFAVVATRFRDIGRRNRLVSVLIYGSIPVLVYALFQQAGMDPLPAAGDPNTLHWPVRSTLGQHIFLGSYLVMLIPITAAQSLRVWHTSPAPVGIAQDRSALVALVGTVAVPASFFGFVHAADGHVALYAVYPLLLALYSLAGLYWWRVSREGVGARAARYAYPALTILQILVLALTGARGAWLGTVAALAALVLLIAYRARRSDVWPAILGVCLVGGLFLLLLNIPGGPLEPLRTLPKLSRLANITDSGGAGGSGQGRLLIWQGVGKLMSTDPSIGGEWGGPGRWVVGYGPETLHWAFQPVFPLKLRIVTSEIWNWDRAHNIFLDDLVDSGLLGLLSTFALVIVFFRRVVRRCRTWDPADGILLIGAGAAVFGHLVDGFFGLETPVTLFLLWILFGLAMPPSGGEMPVPRLNLRPALALAGLLVVAILGLGAWPGAFDHPFVLAAIWGGGVVASCAGVAASETTGWDVLDRRTITWRVASAAAATSLALAGLLAVEQANIAETVGLTYLSRGHTERAIGFLQEASTVSAKEPQFLTDLGSAYLTLVGTRSTTTGPVVAETTRTAKTASLSTRKALAQGQLLQLAEVTLQSAQALAPLDPDTAYNLGNVMIEGNQVSAALREYALAQHLSNQNPRYVDQTAFALLRAGRTEAARAWAQRALRLDSTFWYAHYMLALVEHQQGQTNAARSEANLALYWMRNYWPRPAELQINQLRGLARAG